MSNRPLAFIVAVILHMAIHQPAIAGDGATIIMKSGIVITIINGYNQLITGMKRLKTLGVENYPIEVSIEGSSFFINLGSVALICRDTCDTMTISPSKQPVPINGEK